jgi:tape measure domain-containing protein
MADVTVRFVLDDKVSDPAQKIAKRLQEIAGISGDGKRNVGGLKAQKRSMESIINTGHKLIGIINGTGEAYRNLKSAYGAIDKLAGKFKNLFSIRKKLANVGGGGGDLNVKVNNKRGIFAGLLDTGYKVINIVNGIGQALNSLRDNFRAIDRFKNSEVFEILFGKGTRRRQAFNLVHGESRRRHEFAVANRQYARYRDLGRTHEEAEAQIRKNRSKAEITLEAAKAKKLERLAKKTTARTHRLTQGTSSVSSIANRGSANVVQNLEKGVTSTFSKSLPQAIKIGVIVGVNKYLPPAMADGLKKGTAKYGSYAKRGIGSAFIGQVRNIRNDPKAGIAKAQANLSEKLYATKMGMGDAGYGMAGLVGAGAAITGLTVAAVALLAIFLKLASVALRLGQRLVTSFSKAALSAGMFKEDTMIALEVALKSKTKADAVFKEAAGMAGDTPFSTKQVTTAYKDLLGYGFKAAELKRTFIAIGDMASYKSDATLIKRLSLTLGQIKGKGKLQSEELMQLAEAGLASSSVYEQLAKTLGKTTDEVQKLVTAGKISSDVGVEAILAAVEGKMGGTMAKKAKALSGLMSTLGSRPGELFTATFTDGSAMSGAYANIKGFIGFLNDALHPNSETGKRIVGIFNLFGDALGEIFNLASTDDMAGLFDKILTQGEKLTKMFKPFMGGFMKGLRGSFDEVSELLDAFFGGETNNPEQMATAMRDFGEAAGKTAGDLGKIIAAGVLVAGVILAVGSAMTVAADSGVRTLTNEFAALYTMVLAVVQVLDRLKSVGQTTADTTGGVFGDKSDQLDFSNTRFKSFGSNVATNMSTPTVRNQDIPSSASASAGSGHRSFVLNVSGAGLTPDELMARARAEFSRMLEEAL